jgi:hypothetical protein
MKRGTRVRESKRRDFSVLAGKGEGGGEERGKYNEKRKGGLQRVRGGVRVSWEVDKGRRRKRKIEWKEERRVAERKRRGLSELGRLREEEKIGK